MCQFQLRHMTLVLYENRFVINEKHTFYFPVQTGLERNMSEVLICQPQNSLT